MRAGKNDISVLEKKLFRSLRTASARFGLIEDGDHILVGLSGGKDSLCLLYLLAMQSRIHRPSFSVEALHVRMQEVAYESDLTYLEAFCRELNVPLNVETTSICTSDKTAAVRHKEKPVCFLCSWNRRKVLFRFAQQHGFNKIALGHHQDDLLHTALMNLNFQGHFSTMPALLRMKKMPLAIVRPLCMIQEKDIKTFAEMKCFQPLLKLCPHEHHTQRSLARKLYEHFEQLNPEARYSIWNALESAGKLIES